MKKLIAAFLFMTTPVFASGVCEVDMANHCLGVLQLGHAELNQCLIDHYPQLTEACRKSLPKDAQKRMRPIAKKAAAHTEAKAPAHH